MCPDRVATRLALKRQSSDQGRCIKRERRHAAAACAGLGAIGHGIGRARGATPHQVALAFLARDPNVLTIPKAARVAHVEDVAGAGELVLAPEDIQRIDAAF